MAAEPAPRPCILSVVGTRPEAIKMLPVFRAIAAEPGLDQQIIVTGQHRGIAASLAAVDSPIAELAIDMSEQTAGEICESIHHGLCGILRSAPPPAMMLVQGDTSSALAGALAAWDHRIAIGHIEAGLRSFDLDHPWPEEGNRVTIDRMSDLLFAPTELAAGNLRAERLRGAIHVTGNTGIDALFAACPEEAVVEDRGERRAILVTCHRRENWGEGLARVAEALRRLTETLPVSIDFALHTNPRVRTAARELLAGLPHVMLHPPLDHQAMVRLIRRSWLVLTDSGGLQEEAPALGKPVLVARETTERVEAAESSLLVGTDSDRIVAAVTALMDDPARYAAMAQPNLSYGDGKAGPRIAALVQEFVARGLS